MDESKYQEEEEKTGSECSSGCQSGWTMYLDSATSAISMQQYQQQQEEDHDDEDHKEEEEEEEEDLSMVSDASSGPPHFHEEEDEHTSNCGHGCCIYSPSSLLPCAALPRISNAHGSKKKRKAETENRISKQNSSYSSLLDDTASSPLFSFSKASFNPNNADNNNNNNNKKMKLFVEDVLELSFGFSATHQFKVSREEGKKETMVTEKNR